MEIEPIFASMALYNVKERKKVSENFYFDMVSEPVKKMLEMHVAFQDVSSLSRSCIFQLTHPSPDVFIVIRVRHFTACFTDTSQMHDLDIKSAFLHFLFGVEV